MTFRDLDALVFVVLFAGMVALDQLARRRPGLPRARDLVSRVSARQSGRVALWLAWWWVGWHFFVR